MSTARRLTGLSRRRRRRWTLDQIQVTDPEVMRRSIKGASIGNFMEWYDFGVYGYIATTIAQVFYPGDSVSAVHLIATFSTLAAAFVVRPVGGFIFGPLGDRIGRKRVLVITIVLMTIGTTGTGLLPGYSAIGVWAPILLVVARVFQGLSTAGEKKLDRLTRRRCRGNGALRQVSRHTASAPGASPAATPVSPAFLGWNARRGPARIRLEGWGRRGWVQRGGVDQP
jgi:MFS family permease